jgi:hypothetical protein
MNERHEGRLSTADMASAADPGEPERGRPTDARTMDQPDTAEREGAAERSTMAQRAGTPERQEMPPSRPADPPVAMGRAEARPAPLLPTEATGELRSRWESVQISFVDEPRQAVEQADSLVAEVMKRLAETFASERKNLEQQWDRGDQVNTEDLRIALQRYRSFFDRLLSI